MEVLEKSQISLDLTLNQASIEAPPNENSHSIPISSTDSIFLNLSPQHNKTELLSKSTAFKKKSLSIPDSSIQEHWKKLRASVLKYDSQLKEKCGKAFSISFIEHSHYIYSFKLNYQEITQEDLNLIELREQQFEAENFPNERMYKTLLKLLKFISVLMIRWEIFDIYNYSHRFKGRSLTVKVLDMKKNNEQCVNPDICWFSFAISHKPFVGKIEKVIPCYAEVLQREIDKFIEFLRKNELKEISFERAAWWKVHWRTHEKIIELFEIIKNVEIANRFFEKNLIQEFIRIV